jgi:hypothetical protein
MGYAPCKECGKPASFRGGDYICDSCVASILNVERIRNAVKEAVSEAIKENSLWNKIFTRSKVQEPK